MNHVRLISFVVKFWPSYATFIKRSVSVFNIFYNYNCNRLVLKLRFMKLNKKGYQGLKLITIRTQNVDGL